MPRPGRLLLLLVLVASLVGCGGGDDAADTPSPTGPTPTPGAPSLVPTTRADATGRPNVVVIMTDDQRIDSMAALPRTSELLGAAGTTFTQAVTSFPLCCPSRATFLTGQYAHNHGVQDNLPPSGGVTRLDHTNTLATWVQAAGYATSFVGKYLNGYGTQSPPVVEPGWGAWFGLFDEEANGALEDLGYFDYSVLADGEVVAYGSEDADYQTDVLAARSVSEIERLAPGDRPFFLYVATGAPHSGTGRGQVNPIAATPAPRHVGRFADTPLPDPPSMGEDVSDKPRWVGDYETWANGVVADLGLPPVDTLVADAWVAHLESLLAVDELVVDVVGALEAAGELDDTVIVFTSDNGLLLGEHRLYDAKVAPYEESIRVPLLVRGPGFPAGTQVDELTPNVDLAPTIVELTGARPQRTMDGRSLLGLVQDPTTGADRAVLLEGPPNGSFIDPYVGVRIDDFTYVEYTADEGPDRELYDLRRDPYQLDNLADDPAYAPTVEALAAITARLASCQGQGCLVSAPLG